MAITVTTTAELKAALADGSTLPAGGVINLAPGDYGVDGANTTLSPAPRTDLLTIRGGAGVTASQFLIGSSNLGGSTIANLAFEDIGFRAYNTIAGNAATIWALSTTSSLSSIRVSRCSFASRIESPDTVATSTNIASGLKFLGTADQVSGLVVEDCTFADHYNALQAGGDGTIFRRLAFRRTWNDCVRLVDAAGPILQDILAIDKKYGSGGLHGDFLQLINATAAAISGTSRAAPIIQRVVFARGDGTPGSADGQGIFHQASLGAGVWNGYWYDGGLIEDFLYVGGFVRAISLSRWRNPVIQRATALKDTSEAASQAPGFYMTDCDGAIIRDSAVWNNIIETTPVTPATLTNNLTSLTSLSTSDFNALFTAPAYGAAISDIASARAAFRGAGSLAAARIGWEAVTDARRGFLRRCHIKG